MECEDCKELGDLCLNCARHEAKWRREAMPDLLNALKHALPGLIGESERIARAAIRKAEEE